MTAKEHQDIFNRYIPIADMIAATFGSRCEVVIHNLSDLESSLIYITGNVTGRKIGAPTTEVILKELKNHGDEIEDMLGQVTRTEDGKFIRTSTSFIRDSRGKVIGLMGINFDISAFAEMDSVISEFTAGMKDQFAPPKESYAQTVGEVFEKLIDDALSEVGVPIEKMKKSEKVRFVKKLEENGVFLIQGAAERIGAVLGVTKQSVYNYLDETR
ncbi:MULTISPECIES: helix-turn-helix transcriptional regulator [Bhargavaea]|uniref:Transcriptional regulator n=1 Tax=Bhargavaea changchunensis TaxID=2134037 RepID=A0ABW2NCU8_9BACL|nr:helix-turn-helix transcriptional regulator [Bhargavaea sp. CC-171006]